MPGFGGYIKKENRIPTFVGGPHGPRYAPYPYNPNAKPAPGHRRHPDATPTPSQSPAQSAGWGQSPPATSHLGGGGTGSNSGSMGPGYRGSITDPRVAGRPGGGGGPSGPEPTGRYGPLGGNFGPAPQGMVRGMGGNTYNYSGPTGPQGLPDLSNLRGGGGFRRGGGVGTVAYGEQQRKDALNDPRWRAGILARQDKLKKNPWQQPTGGGMRGRGAFNNYMQNLRQPMY